MTRTGAPTWIDLTTTDRDRAHRFYGRLFGWEFVDGGEEFGHYETVTKDGATVGGLMGKTDDMGEIPDVWSVYLLSDDAEATVRSAEAAGAQVHVPAMPVGDLGAMAVLGDPSGAVVGVWENRDFAGMGRLGLDGGPGWFELMTKDYDAALAFYRGVFGWDVHVLSDTPEFRYATAGADDDAVCGVMDAARILPDAIPSHWNVYFVVADTDEAAATITDLGGSIIVPPEDSPYGRVAGVVDDQGAGFRIVDPTRTV